MARSPLKIIKKEKHYYIENSITGELLWRYSASGFSLSKVEEFVEKFNLDLSGVWHRKYLMTFAGKDKLNALNIYG